MIRTAAPPWRDRSYYYGYHSNNLPLDVVERAVGLARTPAEKAHTQYLLAVELGRHGSSYEQLRRITPAFEAVLKLGRGTEYRKIQEANRDVLAGGTAVVPGMELVIPR